MGEICSAYPSAGSVYHWSAQLVPARYAPLASYVCGWFNFVGNAAGDSSFAYFFAKFFNAAIKVSGGKTYFDDETDNEDNTVGVSYSVLAWDGSTGRVFGHLPTRTAAYHDMEDFDNNSCPHTFHARSPSPCYCYGPF